MFSIKDQKNHARQLLGLALAAILLTSIFAVTSYSGTPPTSSGVGKANRATSPLTQPQMPALKANGKIAFVSRRDGNSEIYLMEPDGSNQTNLTNNSANDFAPAWSPDGAKIAFVSNRNGKAQLFVMNADGSNPTQLTFDIFSYPAGLSWSPDGTRIAFSPYQAQVFASDIFVINAAGSNPRRLTTTANPFSNSSPAWSPDGTKIVFERSYNSSTSTTDIYVMNADGSNQTSLTNTGNNSAPAWQPLPAAPPILNPLEDAQFFVRQQYLDFLNREPDPDGLAFWTNEIISCGGDAQCIEVKRVNDSAAFYLSIEFQQTGYLVY